MVDTLASGASASNSVQVQVLFRVPLFSVENHPSLNFASRLLVGHVQEYAPSASLGQKSNLNDFEQKKGHENLRVFKLWML